MIYRVFLYPPNLMAFDAVIHGPDCPEDAAAGSTKPVTCRKDVEKILERRHFVLEQTRQHSQDLRALMRYSSFWHHCSAFVHTHF